MTRAATDPFDRRAPACDIRIVGHVSRAGRLLAPGETGAEQDAQRDGCRCAFHDDTPMALGTVPVVTRFP